VSTGDVPLEKERFVADSIPSALTNPFIFNSRRAFCVPHVADLEKA
jgi:hypothetical protein